MAAASVVIPAYNESSVVERCLRALSGADVFTVVVANGCLDDTANRARAQCVTVVELEVASKVAALNAGDVACGDIFPRIYLDADVVLNGKDADALVRFLQAADEPIVCAAAAHFDLGGASWLVRTFFRAYIRMPYIRDPMVGSGLYAVNAAGRSRWEQFPELSADDLFVQGLFEASERAVVPGTRFTITAPRTLRGLLRIRTRIYGGNQDVIDRELAGSMSGSRSVSIRSALDLACNEAGMIVPVGVYLVLNVIAMLRARLGRQGEWLTDSSSRSRTQQ